MNLTKKQLKILLFSLVIFHISLVIVNITSIPILLLFEPIWISAPLVSFLVRLALVENKCPLTILENKLRRELGYKEIHTFIGHYFVKTFFLLKEGMD